MVRFILICMFCRKTFSSAAKFQIHMRNVHYTITSSCVDCFMETGQIVAFRRQMDLWHHVEQVHERPLYVCDIQCGIAFDHWSQHSTHIRREHPEALENLRCSMCDHQFISFFWWHIHTYAIHIPCIPTDPEDPFATIPNFNNTAGINQTEQQDEWTQN